jgi:curved DNA-binding protein
MDKDYYKIMGIEPTASEQEIKTAYRRLARKYHPDLNKAANAEALFKEMGEAYEILKDPEKRAQYDLHLKNKEASDQTPQQRNAEYRSPQEDGEHAFHGAEFDSDLFASFFGHARQPNQPRAGADYHGKVALSLEEAFSGTIKNLNVPTHDGQANKTQTLRVKIPKGVQSGQQIRLAGQGAPGPHGGPRGDLYVTLEVIKHPLFDIKENDIYLTLPITPWEAALGTTVVVPTLSGKVDLKIPPNAQGGQKLRLKNRGFSGTSLGDQYVLLKITTPPANSDESKAFYQKMSEVMPFNPRSTMGF